MDKIKNIDDNMMTDDNRAVVNIDAIFALTLIIAAVMVAIQTVPTLSHEDRDWRIKQYMITTRVSDMLVQNEGDPGWESKWKNGDYSNIEKIGLVYINGKPVKKVLDIEKIKILMGDGHKDSYTNVTWWEFPSSDTTVQARLNAMRVLGLSEYNFYMRLHPIGLENFDSTPLQTSLRDKNINLDDVSTVDRYIYIIDPNISDEIKYVKYYNEAIHYRLNIWVW